VHQAWLLDTVELAKKLEVQLGYELTTHIGNKFSGWDATILGYWLYVILLLATAAIFWEAMPADEATTGGHRMTIYVAGAVGLVIMTYPHSRTICEFWTRRWRLGLALLIAIVLGLLWRLSR